MSYTSSPPASGTELNPIGGYAMGFLDRLLGRTETRADGEVEIESALLEALFGSGTVTRKMAMGIPTISAAIDMIGAVIAATPVKLYREADGETEEIPGDPRVRLLNDDTGDTLTPNEFWRAMVRDYYLGKGGYAYILPNHTGLFYVQEDQISIQKGTDPIFKQYYVLVQGTKYYPFRFLRILRNTRDGMTGVPITEDLKEMIEVAYETLLFERALLKRGGAKKGFLKAEKKVEQPVLTRLKADFKALYSNNSENTVVLNNGLDFKEASATSVEMQLRENKLANAEDLARIFHVPLSVLSGEGDEAAVSSMAKLAAIPLMAVIQSALNRDLRREDEKKDHYWAFDTKELLKGSLKERYEAYKLALDGNFMQVDEVRYAEDMKPLGLTWIRLGLQDVLYDPKTKTVYTPNTNQTAALTGSPMPAEGGEEGNED